MASVKDSFLSRVHTNKAEPILPSRFPTDRMVTVDFETPDLRDRRPLMLSVVWFDRGKTIWAVYDFRDYPMPDWFRKELFTWLRKAHCVNGHNTLFELTVLALLGFDVDCLRNRVSDSMRLLYVIDTSRGVSLADAAPSVGMVKRSYAEASAAGGKEFIEYNRDDSIIAHKLAEKFEPECVAKGAEGAYQLELALMFPLVNAWMKGVRIDKKKLLELRAETEKALNSARKKLWKMTGGPIDLGSTRQLRELIFDTWQVTPNPFFVTKKKQEPSLNEKALRDIMVRYANVPTQPARQFVKALLAYRHELKLYNTYYSDTFFEHIYADGRIRSSLNATGTATGRFSASAPNLQNIPARGDAPMRYAFVPSVGRVFLDADFDQIEFRLFAHFLGDPTLIAEINRGVDYHTATANMFGISRDFAKTANFLLIYGGGYKKLALALGISYEAAKALFAAYHERLPGIRVFLNGATTWGKYAREVRTIDGRYRSMEAALAGKLGEIERIPGNTIIQGAAASYIKLCMVGIYDQIRENGLQQHADMVLQVHDELIVDVDRDKKRVALMSRIMKDVMENSHQFAVKLTATPTSGKTWKDAKG